jgi:outer membrane protein
MTNILLVTRSKGLQLVLALVLGTSGLTTAAMAQDAATGTQKIAVLDMAAALFNSDIAKKVEEELKTETAEDEGKIRSLATEATELQDQLKKDAAVLSETEQRKKNEQLQEIGVQYKYLVDKVQALVEQRRQQFQETYSPNLVEAIKAIVEEENFDFVYRKEAVLYSKPAYDITARVTEKLNSQNPQ